MSYEAEAQIVRELGKFLLDGSLYQGFKPVLWSTVEKTALADAEVSTWTIPLIQFMQLLKLKDK